MNTLASLVAVLSLPILLVQSQPVRATPTDELFDAVAAEDVARVKKLIGADPELASAKNAQGFTPLHSAASRESTEIVKLLLGAGADANARAGDDVTPLYGAAVNGGPEVVALLLDRGADPNAATKFDRFTPLHRAAQRGHVAIITVLLAKGAAVDGGWDAKELNPSITPLHFAAREGHLDAARLLIAKGATVDASQRGSARTPLFEAAERGDPELVKLLLRKGANPNQSGPLARALQLGNMELIQPFVQKGADFTTDPQLLLFATISGKKEVVELVLGKGFITNDSENRGLSALHYASREGRIEIVRLLLAKGVDPNLIGKEYTTPLHVAATTEVAELLIKHRAKIDEADKQGLTPMQAAVVRGNRPVAEVLESHGAKHSLETLVALGRDDELRARLKKEPLPKGTGKDRPALLHLAASFGEIQTARVLLAAGIDANAPGPMDETPLHAAAANGHLPLVELLLAHKADVNAKRKEPSFSVRTTARTTPLMVALDGGHADIVRVLAKAGGLPSIDGARNAAALLPGAAARKQLPLVKLLIESGAPGETKLPPHNGTALHLAAEMGDLEMVKWLLARKLDLKNTDNAGWTPLTRAAAAGQTEVVKLLLAEGAKADDGALFRAAGGGHAATVELLLAAGANRDAVADYFGYTALSHAAAEGKLDVVKLLHTRGASLKTDSGGLHVAAFRGHLDVVTYLLAKGADVEESRADGFDLYYWAFHPRRLPALAFFVETNPAKVKASRRGALTIRELNGGKPCMIVGGSPLQAAVAGRQKAVAAFLLEKGASPKVLLPDGSTLLHLAATLGDMEMVALLLKHGADAGTRNRSGRTTLSIAREREEDEIAGLLRKHGAKE